MSRPRASKLAGALLAASLLSLPAGPALAEWQGRCTDSVETYRSLVIHRGDDNVSGAAGQGFLARLPDGSSFRVTEDMAVDNEQSFWTDDEDLLAGFSIQRTLQRLAETAPDSEGNVDAWVESLQTSLMDSFVTTTGSRVKSPGELEFEVDDRPVEQKVDLNDLRPVALFNRLDLMDAEGLTCGEHRIVYELDDFRRYFLIFEARIENPNPEAGIAGCMPIARHWAIAEDFGESPHEIRELAAHMEELFYGGIPGFDSAIHYQHLGAPWGQLRGNFFASSPWQLREWQIGLSEPSLGDVGDDDDTGNEPVAVPPVFKPREVAATALAELFTARPDTPPSTVTVLSEEPDFWAGYLFGFHQVIEDELTPQLLGPEVESLTTDSSGVEFIDAIRSAPLALQPYTEFQATSQNDGEVNPSVVSPEVAAAIQCWIEEDKTCSFGPLDNTEDLTTEHVVQRYVRASTCDGCHSVPTSGLGEAQVSTAQLSPDFTWPMDRGFVHVTQAGGLSAALHGTFLPLRNAGMLAAIDQMSEAAPGGDANWDGVVDVIDLIHILGNWSVEGSEYDLDCSGVVDVLDLVQVLADWSPPQEAFAPPAADPLEQLYADLILAAPARQLQLLEEIEAELASLRAMELALPGLDGRTRPIH